ncbi:RNA polymerase subunit sigma-24, partial [Mycolicibacterium elephantis]
RFEPVDPKLSAEITARFFAAASSGDVDALLEMLTDDVTWTADSDGKVSAARRPVVGAEKVARVLVGLVRVAGERGRVEPATYNNAPALKLYLGDSFEGVITVEITDGRISHFYAMRNPEKLAAIDIPREIARSI